MVLKQDDPLYVPGQCCRNVNPRVSELEVSSGQSPKLPFGLFLSLDTLVKTYKQKELQIVMDTLLKYALFNTMCLCSPGLNQGIRLKLLPQKVIKREFKSRTVLEYSLKAIMQFILKLYKAGGGHSIIRKPLPIYEMLYAFLHDEVKFNCSCCYLSFSLFKLSSFCPLNYTQDSCLH